MGPLIVAVIGWFIIILGSLSSLDVLWKLGVVLVLLSLTIRIGRVD